MTESDDAPPYPKARRTYRILGIIHAPLFGAIFGLRAYESGHPVVALVGFVVVGLLTLGFFWRLAKDHYRGNVPGKPGELYPGQKD